MIWPSSLTKNQRVDSEPLCITKAQELVTRECDETGWTPKHDEVPDCARTQTRTSTDLCPPGFSPVLNSNNKIKFCYLLTEPSKWDNPCFNLGSTLTIFDLEYDDVKALISKPAFEDIKLAWLPVKRIIPFGPLVWYLPGEKWGEALTVDENFYFSRYSIVQDCLLVDFEKQTMKTENCSFKYPSLCLSRKEHLLPLHCPVGYLAAKYGHSDGLCYGIEIHESGSTWRQFIESSCPNPLQILSKVEGHMLSEISSMYDFELMTHCWSGLYWSGKEYLWHPNTTVSYINWDRKTNYENASYTKGVISKNNHWLLVDENTNLSCMACQIRADVKEAEVSLQPSGDPDVLHLVIYHPTSLWKVPEDPGVQCFSNAKGFVLKAEIEDEPYRQVKLRFSKNLNTDHTFDVEKTVFEVERISDDAGEYWCEGHNSQNFNLVQSNKIIIPTKKLDRHDFVMKLKLLDICPDITTCKPNWKNVAKKIEQLLSVKSARFMKIDSIDASFNMEATIHLSVQLINSPNCDSKYCKIITTYILLLGMCENILMHYQYKFISLRSTEYCLPFGEDENCPLHWELTPIGENVAPKEFCMQSNGLPVTRKCYGSFIEGGTWGTIEGNCSENYEPTNRTTFLYQVARGYTDISTTSSFLTRDLISVLADKEDLIPADIYFLAMSLRTIVHMSDENISLIDWGDSMNIARAVNSLMEIDENFMNLAQTMNSSNVLLESVEVILSMIALNKSNNGSYDFKDEGIDLSVTPLFLTHMSSPHINNISGVALARRPDVNSSLFTDLDVISLMSNMSIFDVLAIPNLEVATWMTQDLLNAIQFRNRSTNITSDPVINQPQIIIEAFFSDIIFQETKKIKDIINSRIVSVSVPGYESDLPLPLILIYKRLDENTSTERACAYWDYGSNHYSDGQWLKHGCYHLGSHEDLDVCACLHLTHFAQLVLGYRGSGENGGEVIVLYYHGRALNAITLVGCSLSLVGIAGIAATAIVFPAWRQKAGSKVLLQLSAAIALQSIMMVSQDAIYNNDIECTVLGAMLHYSVLAAFMWMLLTALLQFARYVRVLGAQRPVRFMLKFSLAGWGLPILPVAILLIVSPRAYLPPSNVVSKDVPGTAPVLIRDSSALCYPQGLDLYLTVLLPVGCIIVTNLTVFVLVMRSILRGPDGKRRSVDPELVMAQLRLSVLLFFLLGLSWIFGLLAITGNEILFSYLFCLTATLQGFVLFLYFIVCDPATRVLWVSLVRERSRSRSSTKEVSG